jgi:hypothetical protein
METSTLINELTKQRNINQENWQNEIAECFAVMTKAAEELNTLNNRLSEFDKCKLLLIPYGSDESIDIIFEGSRNQIKEYVRKYEQTPETSKRCSFLTIAGSVVPAAEWAPIDQVSYEPILKTNS